MIRPTVRFRLTAWYASIFLLGGTVLLAISYVIVTRNTSDFPIRVKQALAADGAAGAVVSVGAKTGGVPPQKVQVQVPPGVPVPEPDRGLLVKLERARIVAERQVGGDLRRETLIDFALALAGTTLLSVLAGWLVAGRALRPVGRITATARKVAAGGDLGERIALDGPADELRELADTFDLMLERLDLTFASQRASSQTPLTSCALRSRSSAPRSRSGSTIRTSPRPSSGRWRPWSTMRSAAARR
jgi:methyl-accepting chemotaxis protein